MSVWSSLTRWANRSDPDGEHSGEDVAGDPALASNRSTGGGDGELSGDRGSVTGTGDTEEFVGRISGADLGYAGETGAERRANPTSAPPAEAHPNTGDTNPDSDPATPLR
jgi:hypothetical protein